MKFKEQLERLYKLQEEIRVLQENGLWENLQPAKDVIIRETLKIEKAAEKAAKGK